MSENTTACPGVGYHGEPCQARMYVCGGTGAPAHLRTLNQHVEGCDQGIIADLTAAGADPTPVTRALRQGSEDPQDWMAGLLPPPALAGVTTAQAWRDYATRWDESAWQRWAHYQAAVRNHVDWRWASGMHRRLSYEGIIEPGDSLACEPGPALHPTWRTPYPSLGMSNLAADMRVFDTDHLTLAGDMYQVDIDALEQAIATVLDARKMAYDMPVVGRVRLWAVLLPDGPRDLTAQVDTLIVHDAYPWIAAELSFLLGDPTVLPRPDGRPASEDNPPPLAWNWGGAPTDWRILY